MVTKTKRVLPKCVKVRATARGIKTRARKADCMGYYRARGGGEYEGVSDEFAERCERLRESWYALKRKNPRCFPKAL